MIELDGLRKQYGSRTVLKIDKLKITDGETVVIIGANGSGKSTLLKILAGVTEKTEGKISIPENVLYLPQQSIALSKTVIGNILYAAKDEKKEAQKKADELIRKMGLEPLRDKPATTLSGGELQKTALCRLLINKCNVLLLDEPANSADVESAEVIENAISDYKAQTGCTVIMTTHSPAQAKRIAERIIVLHNGEIAEDGSPDRLFNNPSTEWGKKFIAQWKI